MAGVPGQVREAVGREDVVDVPHLADAAQVLAVRRDDAGRLLAAVLQGVQPQVGEVRCLRVTVDADDAAHDSCGPEAIIRMRIRHGRCAHARE